MEPFWILFLYDVPMDKYQITMNHENRYVLYLDFGHHYHQEDGRQKQQQQFAVVNIEQHHLFVIMIMMSMLMIIIIFPSIWTHTQREGKRRQSTER